MTRADLIARFPRATEAFLRANASDAAPRTFVAVPPPPKARSNRKNDGRQFQNEIIQSALAYKSLGVLKLEKCDPPVKIIGGKMMFQENPFPDFLGVHIPSGRMLAIEAKSTMDQRLPLDRDGGLTHKQCVLLRDWHGCRALAGLLWKAGNNVEWWSWTFIENMIAAGEKSLLFGNGKAVERGKGFVTWDFAPVLG